MLVVARGGLRTKTMSWCPGGKKMHENWMLVVATGERGANTVFVVSEVGKTYTREILVVARSPIAHGDAGWGGEAKCEYAQYVCKHNNV